MILTLNEFDNDKDCPELYNAFNSEPFDYQTGLEDASFTTLETMTVDPQDADIIEARIAACYEDDPIDKEVHMMRHDFKLLAREWDLSEATVWDMWEDGQFTWEPA
jgi:hypothetical protein